LAYSFSDKRLTVRYYNYSLHPMYAHVSDVNKTKFLRPK